MVLGFGHFGYWFTFSLHICCCCLLAAAPHWWTMMLPCCDYAMLPCPDPGVLPTCTWSIRLALGCPTHYLAYGRLCSGTWLPNSTVWHAVAQHLDMVPGRHMGAQHVFRSTWLYISFDLAGRASYWLWYYVTSTIYPTSWLHVMQYGHFLLRVHDPAELCIYFINIIDYFPCSSTWRLSSMYIVTVWTWVYSHTSCSRLLHSIYTSSLRYLSAPHYLSWRYSIIC